MAWYDEAVFYHIYPLGLTGAPKQNEQGEVCHRLPSLLPWVDHIRSLGGNGIYIGPLFESVGHGYETTDYKMLDRRLGDNDDLKAFVAYCHEKGIRVIFDGVFNHTGREFFAFKDIREHREQSAYRDWYCNVNFWGNNEYGDGFSYDNWGGYNLLAKLNQRNPAVRDYICDVIRFWVREFDVDGIRLDAADVLDFDFMKALRAVANEVKPEFWLMGEVIHGDYTRWVNEGTLHSVTNYHLHKALYSGHNDHNYFEIAHTVKRLYDMGGNRPEGLKLYNFVDNHDVERIFTKLSNKAHFEPVHVLLYTLPGVPSIYYGSEFGIEGRKERFSDDSLRPYLELEGLRSNGELMGRAAFVARLGLIRNQVKILSYGDYEQKLLTNRQYAFSRSTSEGRVFVAVNNDDSDYVMTLSGCSHSDYVGAISGERVGANNGCICVNVRRNSGEIYVPACLFEEAAPEASFAPVAASKPEVEAPKSEPAGESMPSAENEAAAGESMPCMENEAAAGESTPSTENEAAAGESTPAAENEAAAGESVPAAWNTAPAITAEQLDERYREGIIAGLQEAILARMEKNGYVTEQMRQDVYRNTHHDSLIQWIKSF